LNFTYREGEDAGLVQYTAVFGERSKQQIESLLSPW
jgi:hypothetical protein